MRVPVSLAVQLRSALLPYIYTTSYLTTQTGVTISYPMYYEWPEVAEVSSVVVVHTRSHYSSFVCDVIGLDG